MTYEQTYNNESRACLEHLRNVSLQEIFRQSTERIVYSVRQMSEARIPSFINAADRHDYHWHIGSDFEGYKATLFCHILRDLDTAQETRITRINTEALTSGDSIEFSNVSNELYNEVQNALAETPVFKALGIIANRIEQSGGTKVSISVPELTETERYILLRTLGLPTEAITNLEQSTEPTPLTHLPGIVVDFEIASKELIIEANPLVAAEQAAHETLLWHKTGEQITLGLGQRHLSDRFTNILSEGYIPIDDYRKFDSRYGNGYADITRLLSACVGRDIDSIKYELWNDTEHTITHSDLKEWQRLSDESELAPVREFFRILYELCDDDPTPRTNETVAAQQYQFKKLVSYSAGSCKDAECYYCNANIEELSKTHPDFLEKVNLGANTALVLSPIYVHSTLLQPGHLVKLDKDESGSIVGVQPLRCTMFMFSEAEAADAFGTQYTQTCEYLGKRHITPLHNLAS